jgi:hypothetical protein
MAIGGFSEHIARYTVVANAGSLALRTKRICGHPVGKESTGKTRRVGAIAPTLRHGEVWV